jgi:Flp pilus assembly protein CpaB
LSVAGGPRQYNFATTTQRRSGGFIFTIVGVVLALVGFGAALFFGFLGGGGTDKALAVYSVPVVVASKDIAARVTLAPADLTVLKMAEQDVPPGHYQSVSEIKSLVAAVAIKAGQAITPNLLEQPTDGYLPIPSGWVTKTIPTGEQQGVAGFIQPGDYISIVAIMRPPTGQYSNVRTIFTNVHVLRVGPASQGGGVTPVAPGTAPLIASSLTVVVTQCQAEYMDWFIANGQIKYTLESYKDYKPADTSLDASCPNVDAAKGVTLANINQRFPGLAT